MPFTEEIRQVAETLGKHIKAAPGVQEFVSLQKKTQQDTEIVNLEDKLSRLHQKLTDAEQKGESLERSELDKYYSLKRQFRDHPLINAQEFQLEIVKSLFAQTAQRLSFVLGIEYTTFAMKEETK
jgi:hypothetical protein